MKSIKLATLVLTGTMIWGANTAQADDRGFSCELVTVWDRTENDVCLLKGFLRNEVLIGLHYGSLHTSKLVIEVLRAQTTPNKLKELADQLELAIEAHSEDPVTHRMQPLVAVVSASGTLEVELESGISPFFISIVSVKTVNRGYAIQDLVRDIFGSRAIAVISGVRR